MVEERMARRSVSDLLDSDDDEMGSGPGLTEVFVTLRFVFDGTDAVESGEMAGQVVRNRVRTLMDKDYVHQHVSCIQARWDESDEEVAKRFEALQAYRPLVSAWGGLASELKWWRKVEKDQPDEKPAPNRDDAEEKKSVATPETSDDELEGLESNKIPGFGIM